MLLIAIALLQASAPAQAGAASGPGATPTATPTPEATEPQPEEPKMKRVCRKVMDPRVPTLAGMQTVCKYVPADKGKTAK